MKSVDGGGSRWLALAFYGGLCPAVDVKQLDKECFIKCKIWCCSRKYKQNAAEESKRKKRLKVDSWELVDDNKDNDDDVMDIKDIEFRMTNDASRIQALISGASASSGRDLIMLKVIWTLFLAALDFKLHSKVSDGFQ